MKAPDFAYNDPTSLAEAVGLLAAHDNARVLAGGQSLMPMLNFRFVQPDRLIDINAIAELNFVRVTPDALEIGAGTRQRTLEYTQDLAAICPLLAEAIPHIGHRQTRNRGTIGGSLAHADPAAELPTVAMALDGVITAASVRGQREIAMRDFVLGFMTTALAPDELLHSVRLPRWPAGHGACFVEFARRHGDFAIVSAAALVLLDAAGAVSRVSLTVAGIGERALRLDAAEAALLGQRPTRAAITEAARLAGEIETQADVHATADYRRHLARMLTARALATAVTRAGAKS
jgi:carbon-monoxide dehydrogenase medium subunit